MLGADDLLFKDRKFPEQAGPKMNDGVFTPPSIKLRVDQIFRMQGYEDLSRVRSEIGYGAVATTALAEKTFKPAVHFRRALLKNISGDVLLLETGTKFRSKVFEKYLSRCHEVALFVMTFGNALDEAKHDMAASDKLFSAYPHGIVASEGLRLGHRMPPKCRGPDYIGCAQR